MNGENGGEIEWLCGDAERLPIRDDSIDFVLAAAVLHHLPQWDEAILNEVRRVPRSGRRVPLFDPLRYNPFAVLARRFSDSRANGRRSAAESVYARSTLAASFEEVGLTGFTSSPGLYATDDVVPFDLTDAVCRVSRIEQNLSERGAFPLAAEVVGVAQRPR